MSIACGNHRPYFRHLTENHLIKLIDFEMRELDVPSCCDDIKNNTIKLLNRLCLIVI